MYCREIEQLPLSLAWKLGLHPSTLACLSSITSNLTVIICYLDVSWRNGMPKSKSYFETRLASINFSFVKIGTYRTIEPPGDLLLITCI